MLLLHPYEHAHINQYTVHDSYLNIYLYPYIDIVCVTEVWRRVSSSCIRRRCRRPPPAGWLAPGCGRTRPGQPSCCLYRTPAPDRWSRSTRYARTCRDRKIPVSLAARLAKKAETVRRPVAGLAWLWENPAELARGIRERAPHPQNLNLI